MSISIWISALCAHQLWLPMSISLKYLFPLTCTIDFGLFCNRTSTDFRDEVSLMGRTSKLLHISKFSKLSVSLMSAVCWRVAALNEKANIWFRIEVGSWLDPCLEGSRLFISEATMKWPAVVRNHSKQSIICFFIPRDIVTHTFANICLCMVSVWSDKSHIRLHLHSQERLKRWDEVCQLFVRLNIFIWLLETTADKIIQPLFSSVHLVIISQT